MNMDDPFSFLNSDNPRALSEDEVRDLFLNTVAGIAHYWATVKLEEERDNVKSRCEGVAFSILTLLDGNNLAMPAMKVIPDPAPEDEEFLRNDGKNWFPDDVDIAGGLHELIYQHFRRKNGE
jgi:hypothetical protein